MTILYWYLIGLVCSAFWPLVYWKGWKGDRLSGGMHILVTALFGPFAIILGYPL